MAGLGCDLLTLQKCGFKKSLEGGRSKNTYLKKENLDSVELSDRLLACMKYSTLGPCGCHTTPGFWKKMMISTHVSKYSFKLGY